MGLYVVLVMVMMIMFVWDVVCDDIGVVYYNMWLLLNWGGYIVFSNGM